MSTHEPGAAVLSPLPIARRLQAVNIAFAAWIGWAVVSIPFELWLIFSYNQVVAEPSAVRYDQLSGIETWSWVIDGLLSLAAGITYVVWLYRARDNAERISARPHRRSRTWVFWSWVIPVVWFWFPYQIVDDIRQSSARPGTPAPGPSSALLGMWWALYLLFSFAGLIPFSLTGTWSFGLADSGQLATEARNSLLQGLVFWPLGIVAAVLAVRIARQISAAQEQATAPVIDNPAGA